jgi:zinc/manganese transport system permease protein
MWDSIVFLLPPFVACISMVGIFGYLGIHVIEREIIFIDIALAQIAAVGSAFAFVIWHAEESEIIAYISAFGFLVLASLFYAQIRRKITQIPIEAVIGVSYAIAAAAALFLLALSAGGDIHLEHMLVGSILWAKWLDILLCIIVYVIVGGFHYIYRKRFKQISETYRENKGRKESTAVWDFLFYLSMAIVILFSVRIGGVLVIYSLLIIPSTFASMYTGNWTKRLIIAWILGLFASIAGLIFSYKLDFSSGPSVVMFLGIALIAGALINKLKRKKALS